mgnify:CR=1 FL=1
MWCPKCKHKDTKVSDSRITEDGKATRRRRECPECEHRWTTFERAEFASFIVVKKDGNREPYDRVKLEEGIWRACTKRPITKDNIDNMLNELESTWAANKKEISSSRIGNDLMEELKKIDRVAYIRFASVYKKFKDIDEFKEELESLLNER